MCAQLACTAVWKAKRRRDFVKPQKHGKDFGLQLTAWLLPANVPLQNGSHSQPSKTQVNPKQQTALLGRVGLCITNIKYTIIVILYVKQTSQKGQKSHVFYIQVCSHTGKAFFILTSSLRALSSLVAEMVCNLNPQTLQVFHSRKSPPVRQGKGMAQLQLPQSQDVQSTTTTLPAIYPPHE